MSIETPPLTLEQEINPWEAQAARFDFAARKLNLDEGLWKVLRYPAREIIVHFPCQHGRRHASRSSPATAYSIPSRADPPKAASAIALT